MNRLLKSAWNIARDEGMLPLLQRVAQRVRSRWPGCGDRTRSATVESASASPEGLSVAEAAEPGRGGQAENVESAGLPPADPYLLWLQQRLQQRQSRLTARPAPGLFSLVTYVYERSPAEYFRRTAESILTQTAREWEWVVLAQGSLPQDLRDVLTDLARDRRVRLLFEPQNLGIIRAARKCLEASRGEYIVPLDGDDLMVADALAVLAQGIADAGQPEFVYSDEDVITDEQPKWPYLRPDWDPVLNLASSYAWHAMAFRRETALQIGVYADAGAEYCQDWDTISRFADAGYQPVHLREVLYHWRAHSNSSTNQADPNKGSLASQRFIVERAIARQLHPQRYNVQPFPIFRGGLEWWIRREPVAPPTVSVIQRERPGSIPENGAASSLTAERAERFAAFCETVPANIEQAILTGAGESASDEASPRGRSIDVAGLEGVRRACLRIDAELTVVCSDGVCPDGQDWFWEAVRMLEFHPDVAFLAGRVINPDGFIVGSGELFGYAGAWGCPEYARLPHEPGPWSFLLKQRSVDAVNGHWFIARTSALRQAMSQIPSTASAAQLGIWLGAWAARQGQRVASSPLLIARAEPMVDVTQPTTGPGAETLLRHCPDLPRQSRWYSPAMSDAPGQAYAFRAA